MIHQWYVLYPFLLLAQLGLLRVDLREVQRRVINWERLRERRLLLTHPDRKETHA